MRKLLRKLRRILALASLGLVVLSASCALEPGHEQKSLVGRAWNNANALYNPHWPVWVKAAYWIFPGH